MEIIINSTYEDMSRAAARTVARLINSKPDAVLGLATGSTPKGVYQELVRMHKDEGLDFSQVTTFNLNAYVGLTKDHPQSFHYFMHENFFKYVNITPHNIHLPSATVENSPAYCEWYERRIKECGGIDLQLLGVGADGHIGSNEPGSSLGSRTRIKTLSRETIEANAPLFDSIEDVPTYAITMGVGTVLESRRIVFLANGAHKADAVAATVEGPVTSLVTASALQLHPDALCFLDRAAASKLRRVEYYEFVQAHMPKSQRV